MGISVLEIVVAERTEGPAHQSVAFSCVVLPPAGRRYCCLCLSNSNLKTLLGSQNPSSNLLGLSRCKGVDWMCWPFRRGCPTLEPVHAS